MLAIGTVAVTWWVVLMITVQAMMITIWSIIAVTLRQQIVPDRLFGRVNSVFRWFSWGAMPIGALLGGVVASRFGLRAPYFAGAAVMFVAYVLIVGAPPRARHPPGHRGEHGDDAVEGARRPHAARRHRPRPARRLLDRLL